MQIVKDVPILLRSTGAENEILAFRRPLAGIQLVKSVDDDPVTESCACNRAIEPTSRAPLGTSLIRRWTSSHTMLAGVAPSSLL